MRFESNSKVKIILSVSFAPDRVHLKFLVLKILRKDEPRFHGGDSSLILLIYDVSWNFLFP